MRKLIAALALSLGWATGAFAACSCLCVNGQLQQVCQNPLDMQTICPLTMCPLVPPSIPPIPTPMIPPIGTQQCRQVQILSPYTNRYEWRTVCS